MEQKLTASISFSSTLRRTIQHRIRANMKFVNIHIFRATFLRLIHGPDQLTQHIHTSSLTLTAFKAQTIVPDQLVHPEPSANITELSSDTFEEELPLPPYARLHLKAGLTEPKLPSSIKTKLSNAELDLIETINEPILKERDLANEHT